MSKFIFTYGCGDENQPYVGGWTEVNAPSEAAAITAFRIIHPDKTKGIFACSMIYSEAAFLNTKMGKTGKNFGVGCREVINLSRELVNE